MIGGRFGGSKFISEKMAIPTEFVRSYFGQNFKIEEGKVVAYDGQGNKVFSRTKPGELASFDEAWNLWSSRIRRRLHPQSVRQ
jgi:hypothetical protein